ncbi:MAG: hypothetical protein RLZZ393_1179, partial [Pseudomonadota bacterium]
MSKEKFELIFSEVFFCTFCLFDLVLSM